MLSVGLGRRGTSFRPFLLPSVSLLSRPASSFSSSSFSPSLSSSLSHELREWLTNWSEDACSLASISSTSSFASCLSLPITASATAANTATPPPTATISATTDTANPLSPKSFGRLDIKIELTEDYKQSWELFLTHISHTHRVLEDKYKGKEISGYSLRFPQNLSSHFLEKLNEYAQVHCLERIYEGGIGVEKYLILQNVVFTSEEERTFVLSMSKAASERRYEKVYHIFEEMKRDKKLSPSIHAYNVLLELNKHDYTCTRLIIETMKNNVHTKEKITKNMYKYHIQGLCMCGKYKEAESLLFTHRLEREEDLLVLLINSYANYSDDKEEFFVFLQRVKKNIFSSSSASPPLQPSIKIISSLFRAFGLINDYASLSFLWSKISLSDDTQADSLSPSELPFSSSLFDLPPSSSSSSSSSASPSSSLSSLSSSSSSLSSLSWPGLLWPGVEWRQFSLVDKAKKGEANMSIPHSSSTSASTLIPDLTRSQKTFVFEQGELEDILKLYLRAAKAFQNFGCVREAKEALQAILSIVQPLNLWEKGDHVSPFIGTVSREWLQHAVFSAYQIVLECGNQVSFPITEVELLLAQATSVGIPLRGNLLIAALNAYEGEMLRSKRAIMKAYELATATIHDILSSTHVPSAPVVNKILQMCTMFQTKGVEYGGKPYEYTEWAARVQVGKTICQLCYRLLEHLYAVGFPVSRVHFDRVLKICGEHRKFYVAYKVIWQMKYFDFQPTSSCWSLLLSLVHVNITHHTLIQLHKIEMLFERYNYFPEAELANIILRIYWKHIKDQRHGTRWMGRMMKEGRNFDSLTLTRFFNKLLDTDIDTNHFYMASGMMNKLPADMKADLHLYNTLLEAGAILGNVGDTLTLFEKLQFNNITPDARSYSVVIGCLLKSRPSSAAQKRINSLLAEMKAAGFTQEAQQIEDGDVCRMYPRLHTGPFHVDCIIWKPAASDKAILEWLKQYRASAETVVTE